MTDDETMPKYAKGGIVRGPINLAAAEVTNEWDPSTSAQLRQTQEELKQTQAALAASQQDLTFAKTAVAERNKHVRDLGEQLERARADRTAFLAQRDEAWKALGLIEAELVSARTERDHLRALLDESIADRYDLRTRLHRLSAKRAKNPEIGAA